MKSAKASKPSKHLPCPPLARSETCRDGSPISPNSTSAGRRKSGECRMSRSDGGGKPILHSSNPSGVTKPSNPSLFANASGVTNPSNPSKASNPSVFVEPIFAPARKGDVKHSLADISLARELLNYKVEVTSLKE
ncbi:MAG: hypothetical protein STSR0002_28630 [Smithella sp.]